MLKIMKNHREGPALTRRALRVDLSRRERCWISGSGDYFAFFAGKNPNKAIPMAPPTIAASAMLKAGQ